MGEVVKFEPKKNPICPMCGDTETILVELSLEWAPCPMCNREEFETWNEPWNELNGKDRGNK